MEEDRWLSGWSGFLLKALALVADVLRSLSLLLLLLFLLLRCLREGSAEESSL